MNRIFGRTLLNNEDRHQHFNEITMALASPEKVRAWSYGEVRLPETINYRSFRPEPGGLFCAKIFGPIKDFECLCGKYKRIKHRNIICEKCGVEVTDERVRRERMGHIELACPVAHILFFKSVPSRIGLMMDLTMRDIERVLYFEAYVVLNPKRLPEEVLESTLGIKSRVFKRGTLINTEEYESLCHALGRTAFDAGIGAEGLRNYLRDIDLDLEVKTLREELGGATSESRRTKLQKRIKLMENFRHAKQRPEWMILEALPVLPPGLRPLVQLEGSRFTTSDLNDLYRRVINRNNRLRRLIELDAPPIIVNNEKRMLQEAVDSLLDNGRRGKPAVGANKRPLKSLADMIKGKSGRFRQNLLGKRVDFSARSVIVVGPALQLHQCGLPKHMALSLFRPFVLNMLVKDDYVANVKQARYKVDNPDADVWDVLEQVIHQHPIMLNRAPTLHRLGIQAFEPVLIEGKAIQLHPLVCVAFNADFDGDQMAVHVPLSLEAQSEVRMLMLSANNILAPANGEPIILPTQDIVLGIYYATRERINAKGDGMRFYDLAELETALATGAVDLQAKIKFPLAKKRLVEEPDALGEEEREIRELVDTTVGRALMLSFYPEKMPFANINRTLKKKDLTDLINRIFRTCGLHETVVFCDQLMRFGFTQSTRAGLSICMDDMIIPSRKADIVSRAEHDMQEAQQQFRGGLLTEDERYNKSVDLWDKASEEVSREMMRELSYEPVYDAKSGEPVTGEDGRVRMQDSFNSLYMMADSGARGSQTQIKQLSGMRGLMTKPDGRIMEQAITANFREGLTVQQYFLSTHGARKGLSDTALKTANSGYLTRRLVDVAQDTVIKTDDCGTDDGIFIRAVLMGGEVVVPLATRILGRVLAKDVLHPQTGQVLYAAGTLVNEAEADRITDMGVDEVMVRSPVKCRLPHGLCVKCYGRDLARGRLVQRGEAVGVIAAQSIGEPGTQLTMRTFHIGGAASRTVMARTVEAKGDGTLRIHARTVTNSHRDLVVVSRGGEMSVHDKDGRERERYRLQYGEVVRVKDGGRVKAGQQISHRDPLVQPIVAEHGGTVHITGLEEGANARRQTDETTGVESWVVTEDKRAGKKVVPVKMEFTDKEGRVVCIPGTETKVSISLRPRTTLLAREGSEVRIGDVVATMPQETSRSRDITGGLPRVAELFEAREPKDASLLAPVNGWVKLGSVVRQKQMLEIVEDRDNLQTPADGEVKLRDKVPAIIEGKESAPAAGRVQLRNIEHQKQVLEIIEGKKRSPVAGQVQLRDKVLTIIEDNGKVQHEIPVPKECNVLVRDGATVKRGDEVVGIVHKIPWPKGHNMLVRDGATVKRGDEVVGIVHEIPLPKRWTIRDEVTVKPGAAIPCEASAPAAGRVKLRNVARQKQVLEIIEDKALAPAAGRVKLHNIVRQELEIVEDNGKVHKISVPKGKDVLVRDGAEVKRGEAILDKKPAPAAGRVKLRKIARQELEVIEDNDKVHKISVLKGCDVLVEDGAKVKRHEAIVCKVHEISVPKEGKIHAQDGDTVKRGEAIDGEVPASAAGRVAPCKILTIVEDDGKAHPIYVPKGSKELVQDGAFVKFGDEIIGIVHEVPVPKGGNILVQDGVFVSSGEEIVDGNPDPHEILKQRGIEALATHIVNEVQAVYRLQGVSINDKHIEVIVHQMLRCVVIDDAGDTRFMKDDQVVISRLMEENKRVEAAGDKPAIYHHILLGITKASLATDSFISAASFQETARVLTEAAVSGRRDSLRGLKENVIVGRLIPAGTGAVQYQRQHKDEEEEAERIMREGLMPRNVVDTPPPQKDTA